MTDARREILRIIQEECALEAMPALPDPLPELGVDSFAVLCAVHALEDRFGIRIPLDVDLARFATVGDIVAMVEQMAEQSSAGTSRPSTGSS